MGKEIEIKRLTPKQALFLEYFGGVARGNVREAMRLAGYSDETGQSEVIKPLINEIKLLADELLSAGVVKAVNALIDNIDNPSRPGASNAKDAAKEILDRTGVFKNKEDTSTIKVEHMFILPAKEPIKVIDGIIAKEITNDKDESNEG